MLNLMRIELSRMFRSKVFLLTFAIYAVTILSVFIPLSYVRQLSDLIPAGVENFVADNVSQYELEQLREIMDPVDGLQGGANFFQEFYASSSGQSAVVMIFAIVFIIYDFSAGILKRTLLCGYSRKQVYFAKFGAVTLGGCAFMAMTTVLLTILGTAFYHMPIGPEMPGTIGKMILGQCIVVIEYCAVFTAFSFAFGNGLAFLGSSLTFIILPSIPLIAAFIGGRDQLMSAAFMPSFVTVNGVGGFYTLDQMLAMPQFWTAGFIISALAVWLVITSVSTVWGMRAFLKKQL